MTDPKNPVPSEPTCHPDEQAVPDVDFTVEYHNPEPGPRPDDNWVHRSERMRCHTCMWYVPKGTDTDRGLVVGRCRRRSPSMSGFPVVFDSDWCGDHKLAETKP